MRKNFKSITQTLALPVLVLAVQNIVIFWNHYFNDFGFPWDFPLNYYAIVAFWTSLVRQGVFPSWIPFQSMGLPMNLSLQSGIHYPPLWLFPLFKMDYTLHAAVVFQCLHVLLGAIGMYAFLRLTLKSSSLAVVGAFIFQFFGGFYSNAEHVDIIRAYAFIPWLFFFFTIAKADQRWRWRFLLIPLGLLFLFTGGYPGNQISGMLILALYVFFQLIDHFYQTKNIRATFQLSLLILSFTLIGIGLSFYHLGPAALYSDYLYRSASYAAELRATFWLPQYPGLFLENTVVPGEISMTSAFVTLPALVAFTYVSISDLRKYWYILAVMFISLILAAGENTFVGHLLWEFIAPLKYSRFPSSDYRMFIVIPLIFFAVLTLKALHEGKVPWKTFVLRTGIVLLWFGQAVYISYPEFAIRPVYKAVIVLLLSVWFLFSLRFDKKLAKIKGIYPFLPILLLASLDAARVFPLMSQTWQVASFSNFYQVRGWPLLDEQGRLLTHRILENLPAQRPARIEKDRIDYSWEGYITGRYIYNDLVPHLLKSAHLVNAHDIYKHFMLQEWTPLFLEVSEDDLPRTAFEISIEELEAKSRSNSLSHPESFEQVRYGINDVQYRVSLNRPYLVIENEMYFPGWIARLKWGDGESVVPAVPVNDVFRGWILPAGNYVMTAEFHFPNSALFVAVSLIASSVWVVMILFWRRISTSFSVTISENPGRNG